MKRCPTCNQAFEEDWLSFCTQDGTTLIDDFVASSEPPPTVMAPSSADAVWNVPSADLPAASPEWRPPKRDAPEWQPPPPPFYVQPPNKSLATAAMTLGIIGVTVGWLCFGPIPGIVAIILGGVSISQINKAPERVGGKPMAWIGVITGSVTVLIYLGIMMLWAIGMIAGNL